MKTAEGRLGFEKDRYDKVIEIECMCIMESLVESDEELSCSVNTGKYNVYISKA